MSTFVGRKESAAPAPTVEAKAESADAPEAGKTRAELVEEAEALGIEVPAKASKAQIQKLIEEAPVM